MPYPTAVREIRMLRTTWRKLETELRGGLRHRNMAKAAGQRLLPVPVTTAPAFDPTERRTEASPNGTSSDPTREIRMLRTTGRKLETGPRNGLRHRQMAKAPGQQQLRVPVATAPAFDPATSESPVHAVCAEWGVTQGCPIGGLEMWTAPENAASRPRPHRLLHHSDQDIPLYAVARQNREHDDLPLQETG